MNQEVIKRVRYFAIIGDNGYAAVDSERNLIEVQRKLYRVSIWQLSSVESALAYGMYAYVSRYFMRTGCTGTFPKVPIHMQLNQLFIDPEFDDNKALPPFFPGLPM